MSLYADHTRFMHFCAALSCILQWPETVSDALPGRFVEPIVRNKPGKFSTPCLNISGEIQPEAVGGVIFGRR